MSRNSSGTYTLPAGNPVVTGTVITSTWGNTTLADIAAALTDSLSRTGQGGMQAPLALEDGTSALPALTWGTEQTSGLYRDAAGDFRWVISTTEILRITASTFSVAAGLVVTDIDGIQLTNNGPRIVFLESDAAANNRRWMMDVTAETFSMWLVNDAEDAFTEFFHVDRTAQTVDTINFPNGTLQYGGIEVGYATLPGTDTSGNFTLLSTNRSRYVRYTGSGGHVISINNGALSTGTLVTIFNDGGGSITLTGTISALLWLNGSGSVVAGGRTIAVGGIITLFQFNPTAAYVWGNGLT